MFEQISPGSETISVGHHHMDLLLSASEPPQPTLMKP